MTLEFQIYDYIEDHDKPLKYKTLGNYIIHVFGRTMDNSSVYMKIIGFKPYFYIYSKEWNNIKKNQIKLDINKLQERINKNRMLNNYKESFIGIKLLKKKTTEGFTNNKEFYFVKLSFTNYDSMKKYSYYFDKYETPKFKLYESNLLPMLRCFHIQKISGCSWVCINEYKLIKEKKKQSLCTIEINTHWENIIPITKDYNAPLIIASFDIECYSSIDGQFPQATNKNDNIIQIGITYSILGESNPYKKWIVCLDTVDSINNIEIISCETESDLIDVFINEINNSDCDIITGYNIFNFDEKYIYDRCKYILNREYDISLLSKLKNLSCNFKEFKLASSALGENVFKYWNTPGRVHIDLLKDIQKTFNLSSYKLDSVASNFIRSEILNYKKIDNNYEFYCKNIDDIFINDYIHIEIIKGFISDYIGTKYIILDINTETKTLIIKSSIILDNVLTTLNETTKLYWSQAKDDISPSDIFKFQKQGPKERALIAKYCIKDCSLVNLLINKLEVVTKNLEMANVCYIPLSYLFVRGQGIKIFSLCLKEFNEYNYVFPVIKVKKNIDGNLEKEESYEGAIVFEPIPQIDYEANSTKDYASLYPSSIIHKNMSHETEIIDKSYDNLENINYYNAYFKENNGLIKHIRFAQIENQLGIIPTILSNLLTERKKVKTQMKTELNMFKYKILDAKQFALKITANSLYGQLGAYTSPIANRNIAACTTSTGREMLLYAKKYDEEILPWIINGLKNSYIQNNINNAHKILDIELKNKNNIFINKIINYCSNTIKDYTFQPIIRYGDSVAYYTPIIIKINNTINIIKISNLGKYWVKYNGKEYCELSNIETWTDQGWTNINRIIRHKLPINKQMYRIQTTSGIVDVTDDHSLILKNNKIISPKNIKIGMELLHYPLPYLSTNLSFIKNIFYDGMKIYLVNQINVAYITYLAYNLGWYFSVTYIINIYCIIISKNNNSTNPDKIISITKINYNGYVYDLTTNNNHFIAGIGNIVVHNTDSVFTCYRFKEQKEEIKDINLFKQIIIFGKDLIKPFFLLKDRKKFIKSYNYIINSINYTNNNSLILPNNIIFQDNIIQDKIGDKNIQINLFIKEYLYENYFPWLWTIQDIIKNKFDNLDIKILDWAEYLLNKYKFKFNNLNNNRKYEVLNPLIKLVESFYTINDTICWNITTIDNINILITQLKKIFTNELIIGKPELVKNIKLFLDTTLKEEWIYAKELHNANETKLKKKLKKDREYNTKNLKELIIIFIEKKLKLDFNKYKNEYYQKIYNFINTRLKNYIIQPYIDFQDNTKIYKIKIYNESETIIDKRSLELSIELGIISGELIKNRLPYPHDLEYEKTYWPFLILTKKKYVGNKYEYDINNYKQDFMGIVLKRRDNAPIVKEICSGIIDYLINKSDPQGAKEFTKIFLTNMFEGKYDLKYFLQSRNLKLKESYKDWTKIAHVYLAEQILKRDGIKPESGNRIEFAVIMKDNLENKKLLQGEIIETTDYIIKNNIPINYIFYMENQIMKPTLQFLKLVDKNAEEIFTNFKILYGKPKISRKKNICNVTESDLSLHKIKDKKKNKNTNKNIIL